MCPWCHISQGLFPYPETSCCLGDDTGIARLESWHKSSTKTARGTPAFPPAWLQTQNFATKRQLIRSEIFFFFLPFPYLGFYGYRNMRPFVSKEIAAVKTDEVRCQGWCLSGVKILDLTKMFSLEICTIRISSKLLEMRQYHYSSQRRWTETWNSSGDRIFFCKGIPVLSFLITMYHTYCFGNRHDRAWYIVIEKSGHLFRKKHVCRMWGSIVSMHSLCLISKEMCPF